MHEFPTTGWNVEIPTIAETQLTGWLATVRYTRNGAQYTIRFRNLRNPECQRNGKAIDWPELTATARNVACNSADWLRDVYAKALNPTID